MPTCAPELSGWAARVIDSIGDTGIPVARVVSYFQNSLYKLNLAIESAFYLTSSGCILPDMNQLQSGIYEQMYYCDYLSKQVIANLGASAYDWTSIQGDKQGTIKKVSKNDIAKSYRLEAASCKETLQELLDWYNNNGYAGIPTQITYSERGHVSQYSLMPPCGCYSPYNTVFCGCDGGGTPITPTITYNLLSEDDGNLLTDDGFNFLDEESP